MRRLWALLGLLAAMCWPAAAAFAHPLGNFTINHYSRIEHSGSQLRIFYVLDMAEIPTFQERPLIDGGYAQHKADELARGAHLRVDGQPVSLTATEPELSFLEGQGGLQTLRLTSSLVAPLTGRTLNYEDTNSANRIGWREIVVAPAHDVSDELRNYPNDMLASPLDQRSVQLSIAPGAASTIEAPAAAAKPLWRRGVSAAVNAVDLVVVGPGGIGKTLDGFTGLVSAKDLSLTVIIFSLLAAMVLGALHGLSPGHGKTIVGAYLVGARGTGQQALALGLTVTATHTIGVFALGLVTLFASRYILPEQLYPWLGAASGVMVAAIGLGLFVPRLRRSLSSEMHHQHGHAHPHSHEHVHGSDGVAHRHGGHGHDGGQAQQDHVHAHRGSGQPAASAARPGVGARQLIGLGVSGGLLPCPSALVVLLSAISLHQIGFGMVLILAFSLGLAGVLTGIGLLMVYAGSFLSRLGAASSGRLTRALPAASAFVVFVAGAAIALQGLSQAGVVSL